jgi:hypothetical protein
MRSSAYHFLTINLCLEALAHTIDNPPVLLFCLVSRGHSGILYEQ